MPIYEFKCSKCEFELTKIMKMTESVEPTCPSCNENGLEKQISFSHKGKSKSIRKRSKWDGIVKTTTGEIPPMPS